MSKLLDEVMSALEGYYVRTQGHEVWYHCPFHDDEHASMHINTIKEVWYCHSCQPQGGEGTISALHKKLQQIGLIEPQNVDNDTNAIEFVKNFDELLLAWHKKLLATPSLMEYLKTQRALSEQVIKAAMLGLANLPVNGKQRWLLTIPISDKNGNFVAVKVRRLELRGDYLTFSDHIPKYFWLTNKDHPLIPDVEKPSVYPYHMAHGTKLVLVGGELDALAAFSVGLNAIASTKGETYISKDMLEFVENKTVVVALDNEPSVQEKISSVVDELSEYCFSVLVTNVGLYGHCKDFTDLVRERRYQQVIENATPVNPPYGGVFVWRDDNGFWTYGRENEPILITPLQITPLGFYTHIDDASRPEIMDADQKKAHTLLRVIVTSHHQNHTITKEFFIPTHAFADPRSLHSKLLSYGLIPGILVRKSEYTEGILKSFKTKIILFSHRLGLHYYPENNQAFYLFPNFTIPEHDINYFDLYGTHHWSFKFLDVSDDVLRDLVRDLLLLHYPQVVIKFLAMLHATALAPFVRHKALGVFPVVYLYGPKGCGKTTLASNILMPLLGEETNITLALGQTESTLRKYTDARLSVPLVLDEFTPGRHREEELQNAKTLIHACYNRTVKQVSKSATELERDFVAHAPLWILGENANWIAKEEALAERIYGIPFPSGPEDEHIQIFNKLFVNSDVLFGYAPKLYRFILDNQNKWETWWQWARKLVLENQRSSSYAVTVRVALMWQVAVFGWIVATEFWKTLGFDDEKYSPNNNEIVRILAPFEYPKLEVDRITRFLLELNDVNTANELSAEEIKYYPETKLLAIYLPSCVEKVNRARRGLFQYTSRDLSELAKGLMRSGVKYIVDVHKLVKIAGVPKRCMIINVEVLYKETGILLDELTPEYVKEIQSEDGQHGDAELSVDSSQEIQTSSEEDIFDEFPF
ncbi:MAG: CHC2 zinc finger domain-containing protein [Candidatus Bathyarchaeia archaeon]